MAASIPDLPSAASATANLRGAEVRVFQVPGAFFLDTPGFSALFTGGLSADPRDLLVAAGRSGIEAFVDEAVGSAGWAKRQRLSVEELFTILAAALNVSLPEAEAVDDEDPMPAAA